MSRAYGRSKWRTPWSWASGAARFLAILERFPIAVDDETVARAWAETIHLARAHNVSASDASYLELAIRLGVPLASLDGKLRAAAAAVGVPLFAVAP